MQFTYGILLFSIWTVWYEYVAEHFWYICLLGLLASVMGGSQPHVASLTFKVLISKSL
jgi:hypothetical protein